MSDLEERLRSWFTAEVDRADRDLTTSRVTTVRRRGRTAVPGLAVVGLVVALVVVVVALRPSVAPDPGLGPDGSPRGSPVIAGKTVFGPDGIPTMLDGERVLMPGEAVARARQETTDRPFLVGGWYRTWSTGRGCLPFSGSETDWRALLPKPGCGVAAIHSSERGEAEVEGALRAIDAGRALEVRGTKQEAGALVAWVHVHDRRAFDCPPDRRATCESAVVIGEVAWLPPTFANGIPREIAGEPVLLVDAAYGPLTGPDSPRRMLVGGWYSNNPIPCPSQLRGPGSNFIPACNGAQLSETLEPGDLAITVVPDGTSIPRGRVVLRVHTGDARASTCGRVQHICERAIVVDEVAWSEPVVPIADRSPDGIPTTVQGEPVRRLGEIANVAEDPFLLGGWAPGSPWGCGLVEAVLPTAAAARADPCDLTQGLIADGPSSAAIWTSGSFDPGPVIVRVHREPSCSRCLLGPQLFVEEVVWTGDELTDASPLTITEVATALHTHREAIGDRVDFGVEAVAIDRTCLRPMPPVIWRATGTSRVGLILVYPTVAAREEAERHRPFISGCNGADVLIHVAPSAVVENVIVYTQFDKSMSDTDRRALADVIAGWLREIPH